MFLGLVYHSGRAFDFEAWHVKSPELSFAVQLFNDVLTMWRLPLLFLVSGAGTYFALKKRSSGSFIWDRVRRLFLPLIFGIFVIVPPQIYIERITPENPDRISAVNFSGTLWEFMLQRNFVPYPEGDLSWHHLWFLFYLFVFSVVLVPLLQRWRSAGMPRWNLWQMGLLLVVIDVTLRGAFPTQQDFFHDWANNFHYGALFCFGFWITGSARLQEQVEKNWKRAGLLLAITAPLWLMGMHEGSFEPYSAEFLIWMALRAVNQWAGLIAILGLASRIFTMEAAWIRWGRERVYPFYIWHQTVVVVVAYVVFKWNLNVGLGYASVLLVSGVLTVLLSDLVVRVPFLRPFFGVYLARKQRKLPAAKLRYSERDAT
ncbi:acetyltransferase [Deinococcus cellulosilyticus NBRC 106333 = KACC 11606]|uniref:Acetyltransferase n=1 Tax=Deinococcus cellulosilyticus (strain DSM 18568 / NBRC 106333 / KACC 11606 / 5516J-15) TaxID=1223518 RepID=A0A511N3A4_DEIC1|nr:acetyltransferase [Deinococcus cellulosilyticus NBRC 106333 = KACC 11606]